MKILVPVDIDHLDEHFVERLNSLLPLRDSSLNLLYVREELPSVEAVLDAIADFPDDWKHQVQARVKEEFVKLEAELKPLCREVKWEIVSGPPALMIETVALDEKMDLVAISPGAHSRVAQYLLGTTTGRVVKHARSSVLILRPQPGNAKLKNVVIGIDGSQNALNAAVRAAKLFQFQDGVKVSLLNAVSITSIFKYISPVSFIAAIEDNLLMSGEASLAAAEKALADVGVRDVEIHLKSGDPASEILKLADQVSAQLIVVGAFGRNAVEALFWGSVSQRVATHAQCPVVVIK